MALPGIPPTNPLLKALEQRLIAGINEGRLLLDETTVQADNITALFGTLLNAPSDTLLLKGVTKNDIISTPDSVTAKGAVQLFQVDNLAIAAKFTVPKDTLEIELSTQFTSMDLEQFALNQLFPNSYSTPPDSYPKVGFQNLSFTLDSEELKMTFKSVASKSWPILGIETVGIDDPELTLSVYLDSIGGSRNYEVSVGASIRLGTGAGALIIPIEVQLPFGIGGWAIAIKPPGIPFSSIGQLSQLLLGTNILSILPSSFNAISHFDLSSLFIKFNPSKPEVNAVYLNITSSSKWTIIEKLVVVEDNVNLQLNFLYYPAAGEKPAHTSITGNISGSVTFGEKIHAQANIPIFENHSFWMIEVNTDLPIPGFGDFAGLVPGVDLASTFPEGLGNIGALTLSYLKVTFSTDPAKLLNLTFRLHSTNDWTVPYVEAVKISEINIEMNIDDPTAKAEIVGEVSGSMQFDLAAVVIGVILNKESADDNWILKVTSEEIVLPSISSLQGFLGSIPQSANQFMVVGEEGIKSGPDLLALLPKDINEAGQFSITDLELNFDVTAGQLTLFSFFLSYNQGTQAWEVVEDLLTVESLFVGATIKNPIDDDRTITGGIGGGINLAGVGILATAEKELPESPWKFTGKITAGSTGTLIRYNEPDPAISAAQAPSAVGQEGPSENAVDYEVLLQQMKAPASYKLPTTYDFPKEFILTTAEVTFIPDTGEFTFQGNAQLNWPINIGITKIGLTQLGGNLEIGPTGPTGSNEKNTYYQAHIYGQFKVSKLNAVAGLTLGSEGTDTILQAIVSNSDELSIGHLADDLATDDKEGTKWENLPRPADFPSLGFDNARLYINISKRTFILTGKASKFGVAGLLLQKDKNEQWQYAFAFSLAENWSFGNLSQGLQPVDNFLRVNDAVIAISSLDDQNLEPLAEYIPALSKIPKGPTGVSPNPFSISHGISGPSGASGPTGPSVGLVKGVNFYADLAFGATGASLVAEDSPIDNLPKILPGVDKKMDLLIHAALTQPSEDSFFELYLGEYTLAGVLVFSDIWFWYQARNKFLGLKGTLTVHVDNKDYQFLGSMLVQKEKAQFSVRTGQEIQEPFGMTGIVFKALGLSINYAFPEGKPTQLTILLFGTVSIGQVIDLIGNILFLNGKPVIAIIKVQNFNITNLYEQKSIPDNQWPKTISPFIFKEGRIYYATENLTLQGFDYLQGFNVYASMDILTVPLTILVNVKNNGILASGQLEYIDWGFIQFGDPDTKKGPTLNLDTQSDPASLSISSGLSLFNSFVGTFTFSLSKESTSQAMVVCGTFSTVVPVLDQISLTLCWDKTNGFYVSDWPFPKALDFPADFNLNLKTAKCGEIIEKLPIKGKYTVSNTNFNIGKNAPELIINIEVSFSLETLRKEKPLNIDLTNLEIKVKLSTAKSFTWGAIPGLIIKTLVDNAGSLMKHILSDPAAMAKILAIEGVKFEINQLKKALKCESENWEDIADEFVDAAVSDFATIVGGVLVGGIGGFLSATGAFIIGGKDENGHPPPKPGTPNVPAVTFNKNDKEILTIKWNAVTNGKTYGYIIKDQNGKEVVSQSRLRVINVDIPGKELSNGVTYQIEVRASNNGKLGDISPTATLLVPGLAAIQVHYNYSSLALVTTWDKLPGVEKYDFELLTSQNQVVPGSAINGLTVTATSMGGSGSTVHLVPGLVYRARVRGTTNLAVGRWASSMAITIPIPGPRGPRGHEGHRGHIGPTGVTGAVGPRGKTGLTGGTGLSGNQGPQGPQGNPPTDHLVSDPEIIIPKLLAFLLEEDSSEFIQVIYDRMQELKLFDE